MGFSNKRSRSSGRSSSGFNRSAPREMFQATCSNCGRACEVPFKPSRPVLCSDCFEKSGNGERDSRGSRDSRGARDSRHSNFSRPSLSAYDRSSADERQMFDAICDNCGNSCKLPFEPRSGKPVYCSNCFEKQGDAPSRRQDSFRSERPQKSISSEQYEMLNTKMDKILKILKTFQAAMESETTPEDIVGEPTSS